MTEEEKQRRLQAYALQNFTGQLKVQNIPQAPKVQVTETPQKYKVSVGPTVKVQPTKVSTPYSVRNFLSSQPQARVKSPLQGLIDYGIGKNQPDDNRSLISKLYDQGNLFDSGRTFRQATPTTKDNLLKQGVKATIGVPMAANARTIRTGIGLGQGAAGLYDLATPGTGTNRVSQFLDKQAKEVDKIGRSANQGVYEALGPAQEISLYAMSGGSLAGAKAAATAGKAGTMAKIGKVLNAVDKPAAKLATKGGKVGKTVSGAIVTPELIPETVGTLKYLGEDASKGKDITPERVLIDAATGIGGNLLGSAGQRAVEKVVRDKILNRFVKETDPDKIAQEIGTSVKEVPESEIKAVSDAISKTENPEDIKKIISQAADKNAPTPDVAKTPEQVPQTTDAVANGVAQTNNPSHIKVIVDAILPNADVNTKNNLISTLAKTKDPNEVKRLLDEAQTRSQQITQATEQATPTGQPIDQATQQEQALQEAVPQPVPARTPNEPTPTPEPTTPTPTAVTDATTVTNVPDTAQVGKTDTGIVPYAEPPVTSTALPAGNGTVPPNPPETPQLPSGMAPEPLPNIDSPVPQSFINKFGDKAGKLWQRVKEQLFDPYAPFQKLENNRNKALGMKEGDIPATRSFTHLLSEIATYQKHRDSSLLTPTSTGESVADVFNKYPDTEVRNGVYENNFGKYLQFRFFNEIFNKSDGKVWKSQYTPEQTQRYIADFEAQNPTARQDADTIKSWADAEIDKKVASNEISFEDGENMKNAYSVYTPLNRAYDPDIVKPTISGGLGGVGREQIAQNLTELAGDYDTSMGSIFNRSDRYAKETAENNFMLELDRSIREKSITREANDNYIVVDPDTVGQRKDIVQRMEQNRAILEQAKKGKGKLALGKKLAKKDFDRAWVEATEAAREYLLIHAKDDAAVSIAKRMGRDKLWQVFGALTAGDEIKAARIIKKLGGSSEEYIRFADDLAATQNEINALKAELSNDWLAAAEIRQKKPVNENVVPYFKNGNKGYIHLSNDQARVRNELNKVTEPATWEKAAQGVANLQKWLFTGGGAPIFKLVTNPIRSQAQAYTLAPRLSAFGARPLWEGTKSVFTGKQSNAYMQDLMLYGFNPELSTRTPTARKGGVKEIASRSGNKARLKYLGTHFGELYNTLNSGMAKLDNAARLQIAKGVELRNRRLHPDWSEEQIMASAAKAGNDILGDFNRVSRTARDLEPLLLYSGATQTGFRQMMHTFKQRPIETSLKVASLAAAVATATGLAIGAMGDEDNEYNDLMQEYYRQQIASGNTNELDSNLIIGIPGKLAYDEQTNTWTGIVKQPLPPDYKPLVRAAWETVYNIKTGKGFDAGLVGRELANFMTADQTSSLRNPQNGMLLPSSPLVVAGRIALGQNPRTGKQLSTDQEKTLPAEQQYNKYTSDMSKKLANLLKGVSDVTPKQLDAVLGQMGYFGSKLKSIEDGEEMNMFASVIKDFTSKVYGSRGFGEKQAAGKAYSEGMDKLYKDAQFDENQYNIAKTLFPVKTDKDGNEIKPQGYYVSSIKAQQLANSLMSGDRKIWEFAKGASKINRQPGDPVDPLFELDDNKAQIVLALMSDAKPQSLDKKKIMKDNPWIKDFYAQRGKFFDSIIAKRDQNYAKDVQAGLMTEDELAEMKSDMGKDFMGMTVPKMTPELKAKQAELDKLNKGTDAAKRYEFLKNNPDLQEFYDDSNAYSRFKRTVMRLPLFDEYPKASPKVQSIMDEYNNLPKGDGPVSKYTNKPTSPTRSAWFKANPEKAALLTEQWYKQNLFDLQGAAAFAQYEGESLDEDAFNDIEQIAKYKAQQDGNSGYGGYGRFGYSKKDETPRIGLTDLLAGVKPKAIEQSSVIDTTPQKLRFKVKAPKSSKGKRLRLQ
jgi:hypothetical protein